MEKINITVHDDYRGMSAFVRSLHESFDGEGRLVHSGRNDVRIISCGDRRLAVKRFAHNGMLRRVMNAFRRSKAQKAYANACLLRALGLPTADCTTRACSTTTLIPLISYTGRLMAHTHLRL